jgi:syntaxin-binding protein 1
MASPQAPPGPGTFRALLRQRLLNSMIRKVQGAPPSSWKVLVVDRPALRILSAALGGLNGLVDEGVTIVEMLDMRREPLPRIPAIFFLSPSAETIQQLCSENGKQYKEFHLFFTHRVPDFQMDVLRQGNGSLLRRVKNFVELDVEVLALESRLFSLDRPGASIPHMHGNTGTRDALDEMSIISERLTSACGLVGAGIDWVVRADAASSRARTVATLVKEQLETVKIHTRSDAAAVSHGGAEAGRGARDQQNDEEMDTAKPVHATLLVLDRAADLISPLMHEFTYQAMAHDLLKLDYRKPGGVHWELPSGSGASSAGPAGASPVSDDKPKSLMIDDEETDETWVATHLSKKLR